MSRVVASETVTFRKGPVTEGDEPTWKVVVEGAVIGSVAPRHCLLANRGRSLLATGWPQRRGRVWVASASHAELDAEDRASLQDWLSRNGREKVNRGAAACELLAAYEALSLRLPLAAAPTSG